MKNLKNKKKEAEKKTENEKKKMKKKKMKKKIIKKKMKKKEVLTKSFLLLWKNDCDVNSINLWWHDTEEKPLWIAIIQKLKAKEKKRKLLKQELFQLLYISILSTTVCSS